MATAAAPLGCGLRRSGDDLIDVHAARYVGGFAQAVTLTPEAFARAAAAVDAGDA